MQYNNEMATYYLDGHEIKKAFQSTGQQVSQILETAGEKECRKCGTPITEGEKCERDLI